MKDLSKVKTVPDFLKDSMFSRIPGVLNREPPYALRTLISVLSHRVIVEEYVAQTIKELAQRGPVVYALKYRSLYDLYYLRLRFALMGLPIPCYVFGARRNIWQTMGQCTKRRQDRLWCSYRDKTTSHEDSEVVREILQRGGAATFFLVDEKTSRSRYVYPDQDPINVLMEIQASVAGSISIIPMLILYDRTQRRTIRPFWESFLGDPDRPGVIKRLLIALRRWTVPELLIGTPIHLVAEFEEFGAQHEAENRNFNIRTKLLTAINERIRVNRGPERMSRTEIKERVLQDQKVQKAIEDAVSRDALPESEIRKKAESFVEEMAGDQRIQVHHFLFYLLKWLFSKMFTELDARENQFETLKRINEKGSLIYVSCHKSHLDYLMIGYLSFINQMAIPYMAAGKNLSFWPVGPILRNAGAFFIRRSFQKLGALTRLYTRVFEAYLKVLIKEKININFYIEGGRSRTGKLLPPRLGMLSFLLQAIDEGSVDDLTFVPTFVGYDQVPEENSYLRELAGTEKQKETFWSFVRSRDVLKKKYGKAYIRFHTPVSYQQFCESYLPRENQIKLDAIATRRKSQDFAYYLMSGIGQAGVVSPVELTAAALLSPGTTTVSRLDMIENAQVLYTALRRQGTELTTSLKDLEKALDTSIAIFGQRGFIEPMPGLEGNQGSGHLIRNSRRINLDFYRNALVNFLWAPSLVALSLMGHNLPEAGNQREKLVEIFGFLKNVLNKELIYNPLLSDNDVVDYSLNCFINLKWVNTDLRVAHPEQLLAIGSIMRDLLNVYYLALLSSHRLGDGGASQKEFARIMVDLGAQLKLRKDDTAQPVITMVNLDNALSSFSETGIFQYRPGKKFLERVVDPGKREMAEERLSAALNPWYECTRLTALLT